MDTTIRQKQALIITITMALSVLLALSFTRLAHADVDAEDTSTVNGVKVASWSFDQPSGQTTIKDQSGRGHSGVVDPLYPDFRFTADASLNRNVGSFPTDNGRILVPASNDLSPGTNNVAIGISVRTKDINSNVLQAGTTQPGKDFLKIEIATIGMSEPGVPRCRFIGSLADSLLVGPTSVADGKWHSIRCDKKGTLVTLRVDNNLVASQNIKIGSIDVKDEIWTMGGKYTPNRTLSDTDLYKGTVRDAFVIINR